MTNDAVCHPSQKKLQAAGKGEVCLAQPHYTPRTPSCVLRLDGVQEAALCRRQRTSSWAGPRDHRLNWQDVTLGWGSQSLEEVVTEPKLLQVPRPTRPFHLLLTVFHGRSLHPSPASPVPVGELKRREPTSPGARPRSKSSPESVPETASSSLPLHSSLRGCCLANPLCRCLLKSCEKYVFTDQLQLQQAWLGSEVARAS